ncbi:MAG: M56 family peptidase [Pedobacter sp.]|nr:MAG: M56 family peptidase [Pedobacter sp.]
MDGLALYLLKCAVCNAVFLGIYACFLKNQTFFRFNRHFLITGILLSVLLPLYTYTHVVTLEVRESGTTNALETTGFDAGSLWIYFVFAGYGLGVLFFVGRYLFGLIKIRALIHRTGYRAVEDYRLVNTENFKSSFSVFNYIFMDRSADLSSIEKELILSHELAHVRQHHWADLLLAQLFCTLQWFNPFAWLYLKEIRENHEFLADQAVLAQGTSAAVYRAVLVNHCIGTRVFSFSSSFFKYGMPRIKMLSRASSGGINKMAVVLILPAMGLFYWSFAETSVIVKTVPAKQVVSAMRSVPAKVAVSEEQELARVSLPAQPVKRVVKRIANPAVIVAKPNPVEADTLKASTESAVVSSSANIASTAPLYLLDGVEVPPNFNNIDQNTIAEIHVLKEESAVKEFGERGRNGVVMIYTKKNRAL